VRKHLFYLTSDELCTYQWQRGKLVPGERFPSGAAGLDAFAGFLDTLRYAPVYLLTDLVEEDFQRLQLPHVGGRTGRQMQERRLTQQYRETPYRCLQVQGRELEGRRDDICLLSALTNPAIVTPWIAELEAARIPLAGLYSTTLLSPQLLPRLNLRQEHLLLITQQSGGLRQSYFKDGLLKFSRLTPAVDRDGAPVNVASETEKTQQFLTSIRLIGRGDVLHAAIVAPADDLERLQQYCRDGVETAYHFLPLEGLATQLGLADTPQLADTLFLQLLGRRRQAGHYSLGEADRYYRLRRLRRLMYAASAAVTLGAAVWTGNNVWNYLQASAESDHINAEADQYDNGYRAAMSNMPPRVARTANMKAAVTIERMVQAQAPMPLPLMNILSSALDQSPQIHLVELDWRVNLPELKAGGAAQSSSMGETAASAPIPARLLGVPDKPPQALRIEAEILVAHDDYRAALDSMNKFAQLLARQPRMVVEIEQPPLDTRPNVKLSGKAGTAAGDAKAKFIMNLVWNP
jgi:hypothetical protein